MNAKEFAKKIDGFEYPARELRPFEQIAKDNGLLFIHGMSDDLLEMGGIINDEIGAWDGIKTKIGTKGVSLELKWCPEDKPGTSWEVIVDCPHEKFTIVEDGEVYCIGAVIHKDDLNL